MTISPEATEQVFQQEGGGFLLLLEIDHPSLAQPIRVVNNTEDITSNGNLFQRYPFQVTLPKDTADSAPSAKLTIDNVSRDIGQIIRSITTPPTVTIAIVRLDDFDTIEVTLPTFTLRNVTTDATTIAGDLLLDDVTSLPFPQRSFTPAEYPGLF